MYAVNIINVATVKSYLYEEITSTEQIYSVFKLETGIFILLSNNKGGLG